MLRQKGSDSPEIPQVLPEMQLSASDRREPAAVEQPIGDLEVGDLVGQLQCFGPEPPHADHGDQYARQDAANCGVGLEVLAFHATPAVNPGAKFFANIMALTFLPIPPCGRHRATVPSARGW
jgi:hypothetical protein